ncbi:MAG: HD domain-containing protein [Deltaproteobacteria bacterium]|nr:HD domain-containing protein [Deltaproteobacteria bacterium]
MFPKLSVNPGHLILAFSDALDMAFPSLAAHQQRVAFIAGELARQGNLSRERCENIGIAGLLHDIGALSLEEKKAVHDIDTYPSQRHCLRGECLFRRSPWLERAAPLVRNHHLAWSASEEPRGAPGAVDAQILHLADDLERHIDRGVYILNQVERLLDRLRTLRGSELDPDLVDLFGELAYREEFWLDLSSRRLDALLGRKNTFSKIELDMDGVKAFAGLLAMVIDFKSPFTATHSAGVSRSAALIAELAGMTRTEIDMIEVAGLLHDLGKLVVPNSILEKPAGLTRAEMNIVKQHTYHTFNILSAIPGFEPLAGWAAYHHERLDGRGYPFKLPEGGIDQGARIIAVADLFTAVAEDRPYRQGMKKEDIRRILREQANLGFRDACITNLLLDNMADIGDSVAREQEAAAAFYRTELSSAGGDDR